ncbi:MAG: PEP-CTERM-box response regulator transcription factor [Pseudomonadota bacterium]
MSEDQQTLLIVEDDPGLQSQMRWCFDLPEVEVASSREEALAVLRDKSITVMTLDLGLPPDAGGTAEGFALLDCVRSEFPDTKVVVITGREEHEHAVTAIGMGAYDFYQKPINSNTLRFVVERAMRLWALERENRKLQQRSEPDKFLLPGMLGSSAAMVELSGLIKRVAPTEASVLVRGETGTGKEIVARNLHELSGRADRPFVAINCAAIPENLLESELFGHEKGSFTGAHSRKIGKVEAADGGTLFLDEIGDMPLDLQAKILRFLQERTFERVGATASLDTDVRIVAATHKDIDAMVQGETFRSDLYFRLSEIELAVPPLRERGIDILMIAEHLLRASERPLTFSAEAIDAMLHWSWVGNVRELENRIRRAAILVDGDVITPESLELEGPDLINVRSLKEARTDAERDAVSKALAAAGHNVTQAAKLLEVSRPTLYSIMQKFGISSDEN